MKKLLSFILAALICVTLGTSLVACDNGNGGANTTTPADSEKIAYTVTVTDDSGNALSGVKLVISDGSFTEMLETNTDGKATLELDEKNAKLGVMITSVPDGYEKPTAVSGVFHALFGAAETCTVKLTKKSTETVTYTVKIVDQNGAPVEGVEIQICHSVCVQCSPTDKNGETKKELSKDVSEGTLKVGVLDVPAGYSIPDPTVDGGYHATIEPGETSVTVAIVKN